LLLYPEKRRYKSERSGLRQHLEKALSFMKKESLAKKTNIPAAQGPREQGQEAVIKNIEAPSRAVLQSPRSKPSFFLLVFNARGGGCRGFSELTQGRAGQG